MEPTHNPLTATQGNDPGHPLPPEPKEGLPDYVLDDPGAQVAQPAPRNTGISLLQYAILVAAGAFATTFAQQRVLANYPTTFLLKDGFHLKKEDIAVFFFWATFAWNLKPIAGIFTDAFPLFGTRRRHYMMLGSFVAGILWFVMGFASTSVQLLLIVSILMNTATVFSSTVMGGLMVEAGQAFGAPGRISSLRQFVQNISAIGAPLLGGYLAAKGLAGWKITTAIGGSTVVALAVLVFFVLREKPAARRVSTDPADLKRPDYRLPAGMVFGLAAGAALSTYIVFFLSPDMRSIGISLYALLATFLLILGIVFLPTRNVVIVKAQWQLVQILQSRTLWMAVVMLFLVYTVPGLNTALTFQQTDVLHFSKPFIGSMASLEGILGVIGAVGYFVFCRTINLRVLLVGSIAVNALSTLLYLVYNHGTAPFVHGLGGFVVTLSELALMDLAVRSTPVGCEALGFALMMSVRNFGIAMSDIIGSKLMDDAHMTFGNLVWLNASTTMLVLLFVPFLPRAIMNRRDGEAAGSVKASANASPSTA